MFGGQAGGRSIGGITGPCARGRQKRSSATVRSGAIRLRSSPRGQRLADGGQDDFLFGEQEPALFDDDSVPHQHAKLRSRAGHQVRFHTEFLPQKLRHPGGPPDVGLSDRTVPDDHRFHTRGENTEARAPREAPFAGCTNNRRAPAPLREKLFPDVLGLHLGDLEPRWQDVRFSLSPALSRWERGRVTQRLLVSSATEVHRRLAAVLPLPAGEGRAEGERLEKRLGDDADPSDSGNPRRNKRNRRTVPSPPACRLSFG